MSETTRIEWTDSTFNPWWGCTKVSPGCDHCYAEALDKRTGGSHWGAGAMRRRTSPENWKQPVRWNRAAAKSGAPHFVFCASMADVFDNAVPDQWRADLWRLIEDTPALTWLLLTKRPQNIKKMRPGWRNDLPENVWLGTTAENQDEANRRIPHLIANTGVPHFLSCEPLLGPIDLKLVNPTPLGMIDWVIVGGESGPGARPMDAAWARSLRDQCRRASIDFFFKQWGGRSPKSGGKELDGQEHCYRPAA